MKTILSFLIILTALLALNVSGQTHMDIEDNLTISSNSWIIFNPGTYNVPDPGNDGLIRINGKQNIILDGLDVFVNGSTFTGYMIKINNSHNIIIRNFAAVKHFKYAVYITNSDSIMIYGNNFSYNKVDSTGWIDVWANYQAALGGGVMMYNTDYGDIHNNVMNMQNDGVALYECDKVDVWNNDFAWNTSYGIRMYFTDSCHIHHNISLHVNRPYTNPSDCAAILMIVSNENLVEYNDFSYSGDGIFLGQYEYSDIPNNNVFLYNECSYSPHNAIEATFADGNIYRHNNCNYSHYGMWLGYSFNSLVDSNEIIGNQFSGIAIDRGFSNTITNNIINDNPVGIKLWEGGNIPPYENQFSHDYLVTGNTIRGNRQAISAHKTEHLIATNNIFSYNNNGILVKNTCTFDTISSNLFRNNTLYHIENQSVEDIYALNNSFFATDEAVIGCGIYDKDDNPAKGQVFWSPFNYSGTPVYNHEYPEDLAEEPTIWYAYPDTCDWYDSSLATTVQYDYIDKMVGEASLFCWTGNGWDIALGCWAPGDTLNVWQLTSQDTLKFWLKTLNNNDGSFQYYHVRVGNYCGGYFKYASSASVLTGAIGTWKLVKIPLAGGGNPYYVRSQVGVVSLEEINYVEVHADTYGVGFQIWLDGVHFTTTAAGVNEPARKDFYMECYPNPATGSTYVNWSGAEGDKINLLVRDITGNTLKSLVLKNNPVSPNNYDLDISSYPDGIFLVTLVSANFSKSIKLLKLR